MSRRFFLAYTVGPTAETATRSPAGTAGHRGSPDVSQQRAIIGEIAADSEARKRQRGVGLGRDPHASRSVAEQGYFASSFSLTFRATLISSWLASAARARIVSIVPTTSPHGTASSKSTNTTFSLP